MGKNSSVADSIYNTKSIMEDESFKDLARYKCMASILMKVAIPEFKDMDYIDIARHIIDTKDRGYMTDDALMQSEIDLEKTESGTAKEKNTINDIVFLVRLPSGLIARTILKPELTVNVEMQNKEEEFTMQRAVYYGASLLRDTVPVGDNKYTNIHKVYTIWFCNFPIEVNRYGILNNEYIHTYGIRRFYSNFPNHVANDSDMDLINVVFVELPLLLKRLACSGELEKLIVTIFYNTAKSVPSIEKAQKINLTKYRKVVAMRMDWDAKTKEKEKISKEEGLKEGLKEGRIQMLVDSMTENKENGIEYCKKFAKKFLKATDEEIETAIKKVFT